MNAITNENILNANNVNVGDLIDLVGGIREDTSNLEPDREVEIISVDGVWVGFVPASPGMAPGVWIRRKADREFEFFE